MGLGATIMTAMNELNVKEIQVYCKVELYFEKEALVVHLGGP